MRRKIKEAKWWRS